MLHVCRPICNTSANYVDARCMCVNLSIDFCLLCRCMLHVCRPICRLLFSEFKDKSVSHIYYSNLWYISWIIMSHGLSSSKPEIQQSPPFWWWQLWVIISELNFHIIILYKKLYQNIIHSFNMIRDHYNYYNHQTNIKQHDYMT